VEGLFETNTGGAFDARTGIGSRAAVVRDHADQVLIAQAKWLGHVGDALITEALAARDGLELAREMGCERVILEMDNSTLVSALSTPTADRSQLAGLVHDVKELGSVFFCVSCLLGATRGEPYS
jgi:ribonuclease HI